MTRDRAWDRRSHQGIYDTHFKDVSPVSTQRSFSCVMSEDYLTPRYCNYWKTDMIFRDSAFVWKSFGGLCCPKVLSSSTTVLRYICLNFPYLHIAPSTLVAVLSSSPSPFLLWCISHEGLCPTQPGPVFRLLQKCCPGLLVWAKEGWRNNWKKEGRERGEWANHKSPPQGHRKRACSFSHYYFFYLTSFLEL